jgi:hypothetical protein
MDYFDHIAICNGLFSVSGAGHDRFVDLDSHGALGQPEVDHEVAKGKTVRDFPHSAVDCHLHRRAAYHANRRTELADAAALCDAYD